MPQTTQYSTDTLFKGLKALLTSLPSDEEKGELVKTLRDTRNFIEEVEQLVEHFPTIESSQGVTEGLARLNLLAGLSEKETRLKRLMGFQSTSTRRSKGRTGQGDIVSRAENLKESIRGLSDERLLQIIEASGEPISVLRELAVSLGLKVPSKERKSDLSKRIATHIINQRGYLSLRGQNSDSEIDSMVLNIRT